MPTDEHSRTDYLRALLEQRKELDANGGNLLNPSVGGSLGAQAAMDTGLGGGAVNPDVLKYDPQKAIKDKDENWFTTAIDKIFGFVDELQAQLVSGFVGAFEGVLDLAATGLGALGDATGWYSSDPFTDWAKKDIGGRVGEYLKTANGLNTFRNMLDGAYFTADFWEDNFKRFANILTLGNAYEDEVDFNKSHDKYYKFNDNLETPVGQFLGGAAHSIGFMLPSIMTGGAAGAAGATELGVKAATLTSMGLSAAGKGSEEALNDGATAGKALAYGAASGAVEVASEIVVGDLLKIAGLGTGKIMGVIGKGAGSTTAKVGSKAFIKELVKTMNEEGAEEIFSAVMEPLTKAIYKGDVDAKNTYFNPDWWLGTNGKFNESVLGQYASGAFVGGLMGGAQNYQTYKKVGSEGYRLLAESKNMAEAMDKVQKQKQGTAKYAAAEEGFAKAVSDFIEAENNFLSEATESQKIEIAKAFSSPNNMKELTDALASENVDKSVTDYLENYKKNNSTPEKAMAYGFLSDMQRKYGTNVSLEFKKMRKNSNLGYYEHDNNKIVLNEKVLSKEGGATLAHEYFGHALSDHISIGTQRMLTAAIKAADPELVKAVEHTYKGDLRMDEEIIANFITDTLKETGNETAQLAKARKVFGDRNLFQRLMDGFDKTAKTQKGKLLKAYAKTLKQFLKVSGDKSMLTAAAKEILGEPLNGAEKSTAERFPNVFNALVEGFGANNAEAILNDEGKVSRDFPMANVSYSKELKRLVFDEDGKIDGRALKDYLMRKADTLKDVIDLLNEQFGEGTADIKEVYAKNTGDYDCSLTLALSYFNQGWYRDVDFSETAKKGYEKAADIVIKKPSSDEVMHYYAGLDRFDVDASKHFAVSGIAGAVSDFFDNAQVGKELAGAERDGDGNVITEEQKQFFKESKVRDDRGKLKVMYHGTSEPGFTVFDKEKSQNAFFFTEDEINAASYSGLRMNENIYKTYLNVKKPYIFDAKGSLWNKLDVGRTKKIGAVSLKNLVRLLKEGKIKPSWDIIESLNWYTDPFGDFDVYEWFSGIVERSGKSVQENIEDFFRNEGEFKTEEYGIDNMLKYARGEIGEDGYEYINDDDLINIGDQLDIADHTREVPDYASTREIVEKVLEMNKNGADYDGIIFKNIIDYGGDTLKGIPSPQDVVVVFEPNQIKLIDNKNPTSDPDIRYSLKLEKAVDYDKHPEQDPDGYIKTEDGTKLGLTDHLDEAIDDMAADGMNASDYLVGETDYKDGYISKRYVNRMEANAEMVLAAIENRYGDDFSDLETWLEDRSEQELNEFLEFAKNSANEDVCEGLQTVIDEVDGCEYPNDEPPEYDNISELIDRLTEISEAASEWPKEYEKIKKEQAEAAAAPAETAEQQAEKAKRRAEAVEIETLIDQISKRKRFERIRSWKHFNDLTLEDVRAIDRISRGETLTHDEIMGLPLIKDAEDYCVKHQQIYPDKKNAELLELFRNLVKKVKDKFKYVYFTDQFKRDRKVLIVTGLPSAGKSTGQLNAFMADNKAIEFDNDIMKKDGALEKYYDGGKGANTVHPVAAAAQDELLPDLIRLGYNFVYPTVGRKINSLLADMAALQKAGYEIQMIHVTVPNQVAQNRALVRYAQSGRYVGIPYIDSIADDAEKVYNEIEDLRKNGKLEYEGQAIDIKRSVEYDNSGDSPKVVRDSQGEEVQPRSAGTNRGSEGQSRPSARPEKVSPAPRVERKHPGDANVHELEKKPKAEPKKKAPAPAAPAAPAETKKPKAPAKPYFKSIETTRDIVTDAGDLIADTLGKDKDYRIVYPKDYRETSSKAFTQINSVKDTAKEAKRLLGILSESYIEERNADGSYSEIGVVGDLLTPADEPALESGIEEIIKSAADTEARSKATRSFEMQLNRAIDRLRDSKSKVSRTRVLTNQRNAIRKLIDRYAEVTDEIRAKEGLNTLLQPFSELHGSPNDAFLKRGFRANLKAALEWYSEENMDSNAKWNGIPFDPEVRQALADVYESLGESESGNLSTETMVLSSRAINVVRRLIKQMQADYVTKVRPAVDQSYAAISASGYRKKTNLIAKLYRMYKRGFAPAYIVLNQMLGETSVLAKTLTFDMQKALNDSMLYRGGYSDAINKKLKELGLKKNFDRKTFQIGGKKLTADQAMFLYNALNVKANYDAINDAGITFYDENGNLARVSEVGNAAWLKSELETILPDGYKKMADFLLATMNDSVKAEYMQMYEDRYGKYSHRNEIGKIGENSYWMLFRSYERITNAEKAIKNPAGMFSHAMKRVNNENAVVIAGALSSFNAYTEQLARELYVKPKYREALAMLNSKGSSGQNIALLLKQKVDQEDYFYLTNTLSDILGSNQFDKGTDIFSKAISAFSVAKLSLNIGTMLKQFASIWTSNIPMTKSVKGVFSNIFKSPAVKSEYRALVDELGGLKYREAGKGVVVANADSLGGIAKRAADFGMVGISKVDLFTVSSGIVSLMHIAEDQYGYKIGSEENKQWVKDHWTEFELSQIGGGALSKNAVQRGDYKQLPRLLFGFLQGANRAALGSQLNKINLWRRNRKADYQALKAAKADADSALKKAQAAYEESQSQENAQAYISAKTASIKAAMDVNDYERYRAAGGMAIPFHMAAGLAAQGIFISLINELMKHLRGKKDKDDWEFVNDPILWLLNTAKTIGIDWVPFANAVSSALFGSFERDSNGNIKVGKGYELSVPVVSIANSLVDIFNDIKEGKANLWEIGTLVGDMTGIPAETLKDYVRGIMRWYDPAMADSFQNVLYGSSMQASNKSYQHYLDRNDIGNAKSMLKSIFGQYKTGYISDRVADKIARLEANGYDISVKSAMASYKDSKGNEIALSQAQAQSFRTAYAKADKAVIELMSTNEFQSATQEEQAALIKRIYDSYYAYAKAMATGQADTKIAALLAGTGGSIAVGRFIAMLAKIAQIKATKAKSRKELVLDYLKGKGLSAMDKTLILCLAGYGLSEQAKKSLNSYLSAKGMSKADIDKFLK